MSHVSSPAPRDQRHRELIELGATLLLAFATVLTAWSAFQSTKWGGAQAIHFSNANAARIESAKAEDDANSQQIVDVNTFVSWATAVAEENADTDTPLVGSGSYEPDLETLSGFLFERFRDEFQRAVRVWLDSEPLVDPDAAPTPFALPEYQQADRERADRLAAEADREAELARRDSQRGDNYVLTTVLFASVLFFAGLSTKLVSTRNRLLTVGLAVLVLLTGIGIVATFPVKV